jgi:parvulin-like peptidyl-prolyl isomerase
MDNPQTFHKEIDVLKKISFPVSALLFASLIFLSGCGGKKIAARVNNETITVDQFYQRVQEVDAAELAPALQGQGLSHAGEYALQNMIFEKLINQYAAQQHVTPTDSEVQAYVAFAKKESNPQLTWIPPDPFRTDDEWTRVARIALIERKLAMAPLNITENELHQAYNQLKAKLTPPDTYRVRVIMNSTMQKAQAALASLKKGVDFKTVALTQSEDKASAAKNGELPPLADNKQNPYIHAIVSAAKQLKPGAFTQSVITVPPPPMQKGGKPVYFLVQLIEKIPGVTPTYEESRPICEMQVLDQKDPNALMRVQENIRQFKDKSNIQIDLAPYQNLMNAK